MSVDRYLAKIGTLEEVYGRQARDQGGHWRKQPLSPTISQFAERLKERFGPNPRILDEGSGSGEHAAQLVTDYGLRVLGVEITQNGIMKARALARDLQLSQEDLSFERGNMLELPFANGTFEGFHDFCSLCHLHFSDWKRYFEEAARVTAAGALGQIVGFSAYDDDFYGVPIREAGIGWLEFRDGQVNLENRQGDVSSRPHQYPPQYEAFSWYFATVEQVQEAVRGRFRFMEAESYLWDHPEQKPGQIGQRFYLNIPLERI